MNNKILISILIITMLVIGVKYANDSKVPVNAKDSYLTAHSDSEVINQMATVCRLSHSVNSGEMEEDCGTLIDELYSRGYEITNDRSGNFQAIRGGR